MDLFRWLAHEMADAFGYRYPEHTDARITAWIAWCHDDATTQNY